MSNTCVPVGALHVRRVCRGLHFVVLRTWAWSRERIIKVDFMGARIKQMASAGTCPCSLELVLVAGSHHVAIHGPL